MSACRNSRLLLASLAATLLASAAAAQVGPPVNLLPTQRPSPTTSPLVQPAAQPSPAGVSRAASTNGIEAKPLQALDSSGAGPLTPADGGFGPDLWAGAWRPLMEKLLPRLPMQAPSHAMAGLARRLLLSSAPPPEGPAGADWLALRAERLAAGGLLGDLDALLALAPAKANEPALAQVRVGAALLAGETDAACAQAPALLAQDEGAASLKLMAFCRQLAGDRGQVELYENLLRESGHKDPLFGKLMRALERPGAPALDSFKGAEALHFAMLRAAKRPLPADAAEGAEPATLRAIAAAADAPAKVRLAAAERAEASGAIETEALREAYRAASQPAGAAAAYQAAERETQAALRAKAIAEALAAARKSGGFMTQARVHAPALREIEPQPELVWFAAAAGRALAAAGDIGRAYDWLAVAQRAAAPDKPEAAIAVVTLWPLLAVADERRRLPVTPEILANWRAAQDAADPAFRERAGLLYATLEALGENVPEAEWTALAEGPLVEPAPAPTALAAHGLKGAGRAPAKGEAVLFALLALGENGPAGASAATIGAVVEALARAELARDARALALEALISRGF